MSDTVSLPIITDDHRRRLPAWLRRPMPSRGVVDTRKLLNGLRLHTVCAEARCPNLTECWGRGTATFMILGDRCTRRCGFCAVTTRKPLPPQPDEPQRLAEAAARLQLKHVVITSVARDDLPDEGATHFAESIRAVHKTLPDASVEILVPDFHDREELIRIVCDARPEVYNHNLETVQRLQRWIRPGARYDRSLKVLQTVKKTAPEIKTKSGIMVGLGETPEEIEEALNDLYTHGCELLTIGQYLQPGPRQVPVARYYPPAEFDRLAELAKQIGFEGVASGPFVRSSYFAESLYSEGKPLHVKDDETADKT